MLSGEVPADSVTPPPLPPGCGSQATLPVGFSGQA